jgi:hypothetical protein
MEPAFWAKMAFAFEKVYKKNSFDVMTNFSAQSGKPDFSAPKQRLIMYYFYRPGSMRPYFGLQGSSTSTRNLDHPVPTLSPEDLNLYLRLDT